MGERRIRCRSLHQAAAAATLVAHGFRSTDYKKREHVQERGEIVDALRTRMSIHDSVPDLLPSADLVDAAVCVLAGADFMGRRAMQPENRDLARREGWIGARSRAA